EMHFTCAIRPKLRVCMTPGTEHDYPRALLGKFSPRHVVAMPRMPATLRIEELPALAGDVDIFHFGWPEYLLANPGMAEEEFDRHRLKFASALGRSERQIVWTLHNRRPHWWPVERGRKLY